VLSAASTVPQPEQRWPHHAVHVAADRENSSEDHAERDPAVVATTNDRFRRVFNKIPDDLRKAITMIYEGHTYEEAAAAIGTSPDALSARLRRFRKRHGKGGDDA
jgi:DNA-directed RNA polymerase specialized sigma24 family protein